MTYWIVNSYGYPNPFGGDNAAEAWKMYLTFSNQQSMAALKQEWSDGGYWKKLSRQAVGSWKPTFEEFGLLYVLNRQDEIHITPAGRQFLKAGKEDDEVALWQTGVSLLLKYPLSGPPSPPRQGHNLQQDKSDILLYWFLYAAMLELDGHLYRLEIEYILSRVFKTSDIPNAIALIRKARSGETNMASIAAERKISDSGKFYNTMNQIVVHASLNYLIWNKQQVNYPHTSVLNYRYDLADDKKEFIINQMGGALAAFSCDERPSFIDRMPSAPNFSGDEQAYFDYLGAPVDIHLSGPAQPILTTTFNGTTYVMLKEQINYERISSTEIKGSISQLCGLAKGNNVILSHDTTKWTYKVIEKIRNSDGTVSAKLRTAKPIMNPSTIQSIFEQDNE